MLLHGTKVLTQIKLSCDSLNILLYRHQRIEFCVGGNPLRLLLFKVISCFLYEIAKVLSVANDVILIKNVMKRTRSSSLYCKSHDEKLSKIVDRLCCPAMSHCNIIGYVSTEQVTLLLGKGQFAKIYHCSTIFTRHFSIFSNNVAWYI